VGRVLGLLGGALRGLAAQCERRALVLGNVRRGSGSEQRHLSVGVTCEGTAVPGSEQRHFSVSITSDGIEC